MERARENIEIILFDLGGVLVELGESPIPESCLPSDSGFSLDNWFHSNTAKAFESGLINAKEFARNLKAELGLEANLEEIIRHFKAWPLGPYKGCIDLLKSLSLQRVRLAVLSNSNELHWPRIKNEFGISGFFERMYASHQMGLSKPQREIFKSVLSELNVRPEEVLFLDDNQQNINMAAKVGMRAERVQGVQEVVSTLKDYGYDV